MPRLFTDVEESLKNYKSQEDLKEQIAEDKQNSKMQFYARMEDLALDFKSSFGNKNKLF